MPTLKNSILAGPLARELVNTFRPDGRVHRARKDFGKFTIEVWARACTIRGRPSGSVLIGANASPVMSQRFEACKRIGARVDAAGALYRHAADLAQHVIEERRNPIWALRAKVESESDRREYDPDNIPPSKYDKGRPFVEMNGEECNHWLAWLRTQPLGREAGSR